jgi:hypothetical protein
VGPAIVAGGRRGWQVGLALFSRLSCSASSTRAPDRPPDKPTEVGQTGET